MHKLLQKLRKLFLRFWSAFHIKKERKYNEQIIHFKNLRLYFKNKNKRNLSKAEGNNKGRGKDK